ncbi:MAG: hypothetical protein ACFCD0_23770 [Gemmataceae bacterium]
MSKWVESLDSEKVETPLVALADGKTLLSPRGLLAKFQNDREFANNLTESWHQLFSNVNN